MAMDATATSNYGGGGGGGVSSPSSSSSSSCTNNNEDNAQQLHSISQSHQQQQQQPNNDNDDNDLSFCILWSPLHPITALLPFIGHLGISDSRGQAHDFQGPYYIGTDNSKPLPRMAFGYPTRYIKIKDISQSVGGPGGSQQWDESIIEADGIYRQRMHNICCDNCHSHVARALNIMEYQGRHDWDMVKLCFWVFFKGSFVTSGTGGNLWSSILLQFGPSLIILLIILLFTGVLF